MQFERGEPVDSSHLRGKCFARLAVRPAARARGFPGQSSHIASMWGMRRNGADEGTLRTENDLATRAIRSEDRAPLKCSAATTKGGPNGTTAVDCGP